MDEIIRRNREFMKSIFGLPLEVASDQQAGRPAPPLQKPTETGALIALPPPEPVEMGRPGLHECIRGRRSRREYAPEAISLAELSYLLWATQGVQEVIAGGKATRRTVPSGGGRHPFETYLLVHRVEGLEPGICRYLPLSHQLVRLSVEDRHPDVHPGSAGGPKSAGPGVGGRHLAGQGVWDRHPAGQTLPAIAAHAAGGQEFVGQAAVVFVWSCIPYRAEWRYTIRAHKTILLDAGHICQNLYLACEALGLGTCAVAAYDQQAMDALLGLDGTDEYVVYLAPVGKVAPH